MLRCRCCLVTPAKAAAPMLRPCWRHDGCVPEADDDQLPALRRLRAAFGPIEVVEVISHDPAAVPEASIQGARMADPRRMTPKKQKQAHALLTRRSAIRTGEPPARPSTG
jgi:hypothetical protein